MPIKERLKNMFLSRKFAGLIVAIVAYYITPDRFIAYYLVVCILAYMGANVADTLIDVFKKGK